MSGQVYVLQLLECFSIMFRHSNILTTGLVPWTHQWFHIETFVHWFPSFCTLIGFLYHSVGSVLMLFSPMSAPIFGGDVGATKNGSGDERSDDLLGRPAPPFAKPMLKKNWKILRHGSPHTPWLAPLRRGHCLRALSNTTNGRKARRTLSWNRRHGHWLEPIQDLKPNGHCGRRWYTESTKC